MKLLTTFYILIFTSFCFSQNTGIITGKLMDQEFDNNPLVFANVSIKGSSIKSTTDQTGLFVIENLEDGDYTLVCSFIGYETKELKVKVVSGASEYIKASLGASTISLLELASITNVGEKNNKTASRIN
ncbi:carboxypeptidase-like regulatory domain-containing protein [Flavivirga spongiicola]|uniref:Carboxypeptidase-like regulatory domain-containing protein n=1 Tax=Flavivirga spongiicola TaxID=421621 RepID=A0ABU7XWP7_9FLAO|nr:carboxypeptidase-like regulatory domain-containing protein [Flavivirga sp. MEBiC05379]MDO5979279.1 carboxypeptidase-like regulatory domain-containing protein [Flavivirga sp. MEBiC05379]